MARSEEMSDVSNRPATPGGGTEVEEGGGAAGVRSAADVYGTFVAGARGEGDLEEDSKDTWSKVTIHMVNTVGGNGMVCGWEMEIPPFACVSVTSCRDF